tara:strand:+ start:13019 stop:13405 length:387 start_codon:yes stop_codon:yes gene_type:complete
MTFWLILIVSVLMFIFFVERKRPELIRKLFMKGKAIAQVNSCEELSEDVQMQYYKLKYFFPKITYTYEVNGKKYYGKINNKFRYRVSELDSFGSKRKDCELFWRGLSEGSEIKIIYLKFMPSVSMIVR